LSALQGVILGIHSTIAYTRDEPHWLMSEPDALAYARYVSNAMRHLPVAVAQKWVDFGALVGAIAFYETPRVNRSLALAMQQQPASGFRRAQQQQAPVPPGGAQVFQFVPNPASADEIQTEPELPLNPAPPENPAA